MRRICLGECGAVDFSTAIRRLRDLFVPRSKQKSLAEYEHVFLDIGMRERAAAVVISASEQRSRLRQLAPEYFIPMRDPQLALECRNSSALGGRAKKKDVPAGLTLAESSARAEPSEARPAKVRETALSKGSTKAEPKPGGIKKKDTLKVACPVVMDAKVRAPKRARRETAAASSKDEIPAGKGTLVEKWGEPP